MDVLWFRPVQPMPTECLLGARWWAEVLGTLRWPRHSSCMRVPHSLLGTWGWGLTQVISMSSLGDRRGGAQSWGEVRKGSVRADCGRALGRAFQEEGRARIVVGSTQVCRGGQRRGQVWWKWQQQMRLEGSASRAWVPGKGGGHSLEGSRSY